MATNSAITSRSNSKENGVDHIFWALRLTLGGTAFAAGLDKFFNKMTNWEKYLSPAVQRNLPISGRNFMRAVGVIEMGAGAMVLAKNPRLGSLITAAWLTGIAGNLVLEQDWYDIAARDVNMAVGALALAGLAEIRGARRSTRDASHVELNEHSPVRTTQRRSA
jgi:uncharacterized membrane protein YphA (DoxX/SURF4 family)